MFWIRFFPSVVKILGIFSGIISRSDKDRFRKGRRVQVDLNDASIPISLVIRSIRYVGEIRLQRLKFRHEKVKR